MIVCHCTAANDRRIREAVARGARTCCEIGRQCGAGTVCGGCVPVIREVLQEEASAMLQGARAMLQGARGVQGDRTAAA